MKWASVNRSMTGKLCNSFTECFHTDKHKGLKSELQGSLNSEFQNELHHIGTRTLSSSIWTQTLGIISLASFRPHRGYIGQASISKNQSNYAKKKKNACLEIIAHNHSSCWVLLNSFFSQRTSAWFCNILCLKHGIKCAQVPANVDEMMPPDHRVEDLVEKYRSLLTSSQLLFFTLHSWPTAVYQ